MGAAREIPVAPELDRDDPSKTGESANTLSFSPFQTRLPPPVAMSLRTRESSSLALKHIFDQINASAENAQPVDSLFGRPVAVLDKKADDGKRDGPGVVKEFSGMGSSAGSDMDARQRTGGVLLPGKQAVAEDWISFRFKGSDSRGEESKGQQLNRVSPSHGVAELAHTNSQQSSEKDSRCGFRMPERTLAPRFHDAGGNREYVHKVSQEDLANVLPQSSGVASLPQDHLKKCLPELDLSFRKTQSHDLNSLSPAETAFGSPISCPSVQTASFHNFTTASWSMHGIQQGSLPQAASRPSTANTPNKQPTAQLTIFYSGMVNVYDDVPADKANAIMLLAGNGNSWSTNHRTSPERERLPQTISPPVTTTTMAVSGNVALGSVGTGTTSPKTFSPAVAPSSPLGPSTTPTTPAADPKLQTPAKRSHPGIGFTLSSSSKVEMKARKPAWKKGRPEVHKSNVLARSCSPSPTKSTHSRVNIAICHTFGKLSSATSPLLFLH